MLDVFRPVFVASMNSYQESFEGKVRQFLVNNVEAFNTLTREAPHDHVVHLQDSGLLEAE